MKAAQNRLFLTTKDVESITGRSARSSRNLILTIKDAYQLGNIRHRQITINEFSQYMDLPIEEILPYLK